MSGFDATNETIKIVSGNYTMTDTDYNVFVEAPTGLVTITLPNAAANAGATTNQGLKYAGRQYTITKDATAVQTVTVAAAGGSVLGGTNPMAAGAVHSTTYMSDGTNWYAIAVV